MNFQYFPPTVEGERITVSPPNAVELQGAAKWKGCLVGHFMDKKIPFLAVRSVAFKKWADYGLTVAIAIKYLWRPVKCGSCKVFGHSNCSQKVVQAPEGVTDPIKAAPKGQLMDKEDTSGMVMVLEAAEVHLDSCEVMHKESLGATSIRTVPSSSKVMEEPHYGPLPDVLGEGMEDLDALFQALTSMEMVDTYKPKEGKNPGATKRGRKPKNR
ncbi:hypothetical protein RHGRI_015852 [Rhododendron griersonianum]|uniref:Uncharacterized protein n=1 Tax=Rhododendron griersonianum TaxID=479676 RepID=A0AAV6JS33_9ERIC|nr:hypothetical protein RHGRI_015852 [Rhododendron griersonianum]